MEDHYKLIMIKIKTLNNKSLFKRVKLIWWLILKILCRWINSMIRILFFMTVDWDKSRDQIESLSTKKMRSNSQQMVLIFSRKFFNKMQSSIVFKPWKHKRKCYHKERKKFNARENWVNLSRLCLIMLWWNNKEKERQKPFMISISFKPEEIKILIQRSVVFWFRKWVLNCNTSLPFLKKKQIKSSLLRGTRFTKSWTWRQRTSQKWIMISIYREWLCCKERWVTSSRWILDSLNWMIECKKKVLWQLFFTR